MAVNPFPQTFFHATMYAMANRGAIVNINDMAAELIKLAGSQTEAARLSNVSQANLSKLAARQIGQGVRADTAAKIKTALTKLKRRKKKG